MNNNRLRILEFDLEKKFWQKSQLVAGVDEVGRGCLAGPVTSATVIFKINQTPIQGIQDSKKLSSIEREKLFKIISETALNISYHFVDNQIIDKINILQATMISMENSIATLTIKPDIILIDGNYFLNKSYNFHTMVKGDSISPSIAAASIIAKVIRDKWMIEVADSEFPEYDFKTNKGYGTKAHLRAISKYGICKYHRVSFLKKFLNRQNTLFK